jgi:hypothetical protein
MTRDALIAIGRKLVAAEGTEAELDALYEEFCRNVPHPRGANLLYWPENYDARRDSAGEYNPTVEEVVDQALAYRPLITPPPPQD